MKLKLKQVSLSTLNECTKQEIFDKVADHLLTQMKRCADKNDLGASYRCDGLTSAIGCLMTDLEYQETFEGRDWTTLVHSGIVPADHEKFLAALQFLHDLTEPEDWGYWLSVVAKRHGLNTHVLENFI